MGRFDRSARPLAAGMLGALAVVAAPATGEGSTVGHDAVGAAAAQTHLVLKLSDFRIDPYVNAVGHGRLTITVVNRGKVKHEMLVVNAKGKLRLKGRRVDERALERAHRVVGEISHVGPRSRASKTFNLKKGSYMLFCNLRGHYGAGMRATLIVRGRRR